MGSPSFHSGLCEDLLERKTMKTSEEWRAEIESKRVAKPSDFDNLDDDEANRERTCRLAFEVWHKTLVPSRHREVRYERGSDGEYKNRGVAKAYRAFKHGFQAGVKYNGKV